MGDWSWGLFLLALGAGSAGAMIFILLMERLLWRTPREEDR